MSLKLPPLVRSGVLFLFSCLLVGLSRLFFVLFYSTVFPTPLQSTGTELSTT